MRGDYQEGGDLFSYVSLEQRIPKRHPIRKMRKRWMKVANWIRFSIDLRGRDLLSRR
ncbi:MAG: hypothetical protein IPG06_25710 [Haliea sp.]|nr:hypothetical protein [Haliea sp.]